MRKLIDIDVNEVSLWMLVNIPANKTKYFIVKNDKSFEEKNHLAKIAFRQDDKNENRKKEEVNKMDELVKLYKSLYKDEIAKDMKPEVKTFAEEDIKILKNALDIFKKYREDLPDELIDGVINLAKFAVSKYPEKEEKKDDTEVEKSGAKLSKDSLANLKKAIECLMSILPEEDQPEVKKVEDKPEEKVEKKEEKKEEPKEENGFEKSLKEFKESILGEISKNSKIVEDVVTRLGKVEEVKGVKKSIEEEKVDKDKEKVKKGNWPSLMPEDDE